MDRAKDIGVIVRWLPVNQYKDHFDAAHVTENGLVPVVTVTKETRLKYVSKGPFFRSLTPGDLDEINAVMHAVMSHEMHTRPGFPAVAHYFDQFRDVLPNVGAEFFQHAAKEIKPDKQTIIAAYQGMIHGTVPPEAVDALMTPMPDHLSAEEKAEIKQAILEDNVGAKRPKRVTVLEKLKYFW